MTDPRLKLLTSAAQSVQRDRRMELRKAIASALKTVRCMSDDNSIGIGLITETRRLAISIGQAKQPRKPGVEEENYTCERCRQKESDARMAEGSAKGLRALEQIRRARAAAPGAPRTFR